MTTTQDRPRTSYLGGGDMAAICGKSEWRTPMDVWLEKTGKAQPRGINERMQFGILLEPIIVAEWARRNNCTAEAGGFIEDPQEPWRAGHPDAIAAWENGPKRVIEAKAVGAYQLSEWQKAIPIDYQYQGQHYLSLAKLSLCTYPVLFGGQKLLSFDLEEDPIVQHEIQTCSRDFWHDYVLKDTPPPGQSVEHAGALFGTREATPTERAVLGELAVLRARAADNEDAIEARMAALQDWARDVTLTVNGVVAVQWKHAERKAYTVSAKSYDYLAVPRYTTLAKLLNINLAPNPETE